MFSSPLYHLHRAMVHSSIILLASLALLGGYFLISRSIVYATSHERQQSFLGLFIVSPTPPATPIPTATPTPSPTPSPTPIVYPVALSIPAIGVDSRPLEYISVTTDGAMETPRDLWSAGWIQIGPKPGEMGSAIITGHYDDPWGQPVIFGGLKYLQNGNEISIHMADGSMRTFIVEYMGELDAYTGDVEAITRQTDYPSLTLVTCHGTWDAQNGIYSKRLIVYAKMM